MAGSPKIPLGDASPGVPHRDGLPNGTTASLEWRTFDGLDHRTLPDQALVNGRNPGVLNRATSAMLAAGVPEHVAVSLGPTVRVFVEHGELYDVYRDSDEATSSAIIDGVRRLLQRVGDVAVLSKNGIATSWVGGRWWLDPDSDEDRGQTFRCPLDGSLDILADCTPYGNGGREAAGPVQAVLDVDGDEKEEVISSLAGRIGIDDMVTVYDDDGSVLATVAGTQGEKLGFRLLGLMDDDGDPWVLMATSGPSGEVHAFRGERLVGELSDADADAVFDGPAGTGHGMAAYRETPDAPLTLVLGSPFYAYGPVYLVPFGASLE